MRFYYFVIFILSALPVFSQSNDSQSADPLLTHHDSTEITVSGRFEQQPVSAILKQLLQNKPISLFISDEGLLDQPKTITFSRVTLTEALADLFKDTSVGYIYYRDYALVVGPKSRINQDYGGRYYSRLTEIISQVADPDELIIGDRQSLNPFEVVTLSGQIKDDLTGGLIAGATVMLSDSGAITVTDGSGNFNIKVATGKRNLIVQYIGYDQLVKPIMVYSNDTISLALSKNVLNLDEVTIEAVADDANIESTQVGMERIDMKGINKIPVFLGEVDIEKVLLLQPGVSKVAEGSAGFNVRGGEVDQNLILLDEGLLLNSSHALGFLSTFNPDMVQSAELYKGAMPAYYGGRLSSVLDVKTRNGDFQNFKLKAGLSPIAGKLNVETPVIRDKSSISAGLRYNYADLVLKLGNTPDVRQSSSFFYDALIRYAHKITQNTNVEASFYWSNDEFRFSREFGFDYQTLMAQMSIKSQINPRWFSNLSLVANDYQSSRQELDNNIASKLDNYVRYLKLKEVLSYVVSESFKIDGGISAILYKVNPGSIAPTSETSVVVSKQLENEQGLESAIFIQAELEASANLSFSGGLRGVWYQYRGPKSVYQYTAGLPVQLENIEDTLYFDKGEIIESYYSLEPRLSFRYRLNPTESVKGGYSRTVQFINQISNFTAPTPSSVWQLSNTHIEPARAHNFSLGFFKNYAENLWETGIEGYFRTMDQLTDYKDFADLNVNDHLETELASGQGRSYGLELSIRKKRGLFNGWLSYTLSRTERQVDAINSGEWYPSNLDKTHDVSLVGIFDFNQRHSISISFNYATGRPTTAPIGSYLNEDGLVIPVYSQRNEFRTPDFHRLDLSYTIGQGYNKSKKVRTSWSFSIYNLYGRKNPYSVFFVQKPFNFPTANRFAVLGSVFPSVSFNIEIQ